MFVNLSLIERPLKGISAGIQDQDDPKSYSTHTCGVKGSNHKRPLEESDSGSKAKKQRHSGSQTSDAGCNESAATMERRGSHQEAGTKDSKSSDEPRVNPIDHIFQFHKARLCSS